MDRSRLALLLAVFLIVGSTTHAAGAVEPPERGVERTAMPSLAAFLRAAKSKARSGVEARAVVEEREREREQSILAFVPSLRASAGYRRNQYESAIDLPEGTGTRHVVITPRDQLDASVHVDVTLIDPTTIANYAQADARYESAKASEDATSIDVERAVHQAYWQCVAADAVRGAAERALDVAKENEKVVTVRREADLASDLDVARASAAVDRAVQTLAEARLNRALAARKLRSLTGLDASGDAPPFPTDLDPVAGLETYRSRASGVATVRVATADSRAAAISVTQAWTPLVPRIVGFFEERLTNATGFSGEVASYAFGLTAEWRLDPQQIGAVRTQTAAQRLADVRRESRLRDAEDAIEDAWLEVDSRREAARAARSEEAAAKKAAEVARSLYLANKATQVDVIVADRDLLQAEVNRIQADANLELARTTLRLASGMEKAR